MASQANAPEVKRSAWNVKIPKIKKAAPEPVALPVPQVKELKQLKLLTRSPTPSPFFSYKSASPRRARGATPSPRGATAASPMSDKTVSKMFFQPLTSVKKTDKSAMSPFVPFDSPTPSPPSKVRPFIDTVMPLKVGQGTYGCVYSPAIPCSDPAIPYCPSCVSKLMINQDAEAQFAEYETLNGIDDEQLTLVKNPLKCKPNPRVMNRIEKCTIRGQEVKWPTMITYPNGGPNLWTEVNETQRDPRHVLKHFANVIKGVSILNRAGVYHLDIKEANLVTGARGNGPYKIIDFGLMEKITDLTAEPRYNGMFAKLYELWPVDMLFLSGEVHPDKLSAHIDTFLKQYNIIAQYYNNVKGYDVKSIKKALKHKMSLSPAENYHESIKKVDVYSIGRILLDFSMRYEEFGPKLRDLIDRSKILDPNPALRPDAKILHERYVIKFADLMV